MDYKFQVNLQGIIDLLSHHLYSSPEVYLRELLQNGVDAIRARQRAEPGFQGEIQLEVIPGEGDQARPTLVFQDSGIGLTDDEVHQFLATIGESSKRGGLDRQREDFIGQFGIGLLSCFIVSDEVVMITRSAKQPQSPTLKWTGRPDGTYQLEELPYQVQPGTQLFLRAKAGTEQYFQRDQVVQLARRFGGFLPIAITVHAGGEVVAINETPPWLLEGFTPEELRQKLLAWGQEVFEEPFFDAIRLHSEAGQVEGVAFVLPYSPSPASRRKQRVYLKNMLLSDTVEGLLPDWAFFVKCVLNASDLRPTASREGFYEDDALRSARESLGHALRGYLVRLAESDPERLEQFIRLHSHSIKLLAVHDDEFFEMFVDWIPLDTSLGRMKVGEIRAASDVVRYAYPLEQFRQIASVAASQGMLIVNGGYDYDAEMLERMPTVFPGTEVQRVEAEDLVARFQDLTPGEEQRVAAFRELADEVLRPLKCIPEIKRFKPTDLPALYGANREAYFRRAVEKTQEVSDDLWAGVLGNLTPAGHDQRARLCFNYNNPLVRKLIMQRDPVLLRRSLEMLYVQSLLLGQHPLSSQEMHLLSEGLLGLIQWGIDQHSPADEEDA